MIELVLYVNIRTQCRNDNLLVYLYLFFLGMMERLPSLTVQNIHVQSIVACDLHQIFQTNITNETEG